MLKAKTVKELREIAKRMELKIPGVALSRATKDLLITGIEALIEYDHMNALDMNASQEVSYTIPGTDFVLTGLSAQMMIRHEKNVRRYNPTFKRDKSGKVILTAKQTRRVQKKLRSYGKKIGFYDSVS